MKLKEFAENHPKAVVGFSGGVDSSYLLYAGLSAGADWRPVYVRTVFQPAFEYADAQRMCAFLGVELTVIQEDILAYQKIRENPSDRCYHCKRVLFGRIAAWTKDQGIPLLLDGNNASDPIEDRPGMRAAQELGVRSPLREAGLTKQEIRELSREAGLFTWNKPAYACLATRIPTGIVLEPETLKKVETGEESLREMGFSDLRIRVFHGAARLQIPESQMETVIQKREQILHRLEPVFSTVMLDLNARPDMELSFPPKKREN